MITHCWFHSSINNKYRGFSNSTYSKFTIDGKEYQTCEHYFQSKKFEGILDENIVYETETSREARIIGQQKKRPLRTDWEEVKEDIMYIGVKAKFVQNPHLRKLLLETNDLIICEHNKNSYWGDGADPCWTPDSTYGKNKLGKILMRIREELKYIVSNICHNNMEELNIYIKSIANKLILNPLKLSAHIRATTNVKFNKAGDLLFTTAKDTTPMVWDTKTGQRLGTYNGHEGSVWTCDINSDSTLLITGSADQTLKFWEVSTGKLIKEVEFEAGVRSVNFGTDNLICVVTDTMFGETPKIIVYNISDIDNIFIILEYKNSVKINKAIINKDNIYLCSVDGSVSILNIYTNDVISKYIHKGYNCKSIRFNNNNTMLITASDDCTACLLDIRNLDIIKKYNVNFPVNNSLVSNEIVITAGGLDAQSVTTSEGNRFDIKFYSKIFEEFLGSFSNHFGPVNSIDMTEDGKLFASAGEDGFCYIYHIEVKK